MNQQKKSYTVRPDAETIAAFEACKTRAEVVAGTVLFEGTIALGLLRDGLKARGFLKNDKQTSLKKGARK